MNENIINESKAIKVLFQKLINDNYKQKEYRDIYTIDILPKIVNNTIKYEDFEANILKNNSYNILNKYVLALSKLYLYDNHIFKLSQDEGENLSFEPYDNDINRFIDDIIYNLSVKNKRMDIIFNELKIGLEINSWCIKIMDFGCSDLRFVMDMFKSEGLFIRRPYF
ncbi:hypothetical protein [Clostridium celatum]|uniref:Uncharacterized protein n=1 Tax=Clostridium celatum DSM 1785 TaxID=545697 RepID=L1QLH5_9CLOT|nr:hypothetical protein [Clostridium celatum]EKY28808.1 hypothetical protein HMPREF0216_00552 [Clostridium celatum DSM 1785]MCE9656726.1 hypothetical protein [Clostridium celatum]MDU3722336.1 hypothetical protein [Clostridium celatum]MDU6297293.1 hypothetical protein [Clostridium celatum]MDY3360410.1 hypothetical protein [Clostridium celatum]